MSTFGQPVTQANILWRAIGNLPDGPSSELARFFLSLTLDPADEARANELASMARQGNLSTTENAELESYQRCLRFMDEIKLRARLSLEKKP